MHALTHPPSPACLPRSNLYVANLRKSMTDQEQLRAAFAAYGAVSHSSLSLNNQGVSKCYGFVEYVRSDESDAAVRGMDGQEHPVLGKVRGWLDCLLVAACWLGCLH